MDSEARAIEEKVRREKVDVASLYSYFEKNVLKYGEKRNLIESKAELQAKEKLSERKL